MNDEIHIEELGLKHLDFIQKRLKEIEMRMDQLVSEGLYQKTQRNLGRLPFPEKTKEHTELMKLRIRYERRQSELLDKPYEPDPRDGLSAGEALAFDKGVHWAMKKRQNTAPKSMPVIKRLILLEAEARWKEEGDNPTPRKILLKEFAGYARQDWELIAIKHELELPEKLKLYGVKAMESLFQSIAGKGFIEIPDGVANDGAPKK